VLRGGEKQKHSDACRRRLISEMKEEPKVKEAKKRESEFMAEVIEEVERKRRKAESLPVVEEKEPGQRGESSSSSTSVRGTKRRTEIIGNDAEYDEEGTRINKVEKEKLVEKTRYVNVEDRDEEMIQVAFDDVTGDSLDPGVVMKSRGEEIDFMRTRGIWEVVPTSLCWQITGCGPTSVKWVDTKRGAGL